MPKVLGSDVSNYDSIRIATVKYDTLYIAIHFATPDSFYIFLPEIQIMLSTIKIVEPTQMVSAI